MPLIRLIRSLIPNSLRCAAPFVLFALVLVATLSHLVYARAGGGGGVEPGTYIVTLTANGKTLTKPVTVLQDRWLGEK